MYFKTIDNLSLTVIKKGFWPHLFKSRFNDYLNGKNKKEYEKELKEKIFNNFNYSLTENAYPFNLGKNIEQYIIWVKNNNEDINKIKNIVDYSFPHQDYLIYLNKPENRSIQSILHYHILIKNQSHSKLIKTIIFNRHGNRFPITKIKFFEKIMNGDEKHNEDANLLPIGFTNSFNLGKELKEYYNNNNVICFSSPYQRCQDTIQSIMDGLNINEKINIENDLKFTTKNLILDITDEDLDIFYNKYIPILRIMEQILKIESKIAYTSNDKINNLYKFYEYYSSIICYSDLGIDIDKYIPKKFNKEFNETTKIVLNTLFDKYQNLINDYLEEILNKYINLNNNLILCSTHDNLVFILAKYIAKKNNINDLLELPDYLSTVRIEIWDNMIRIYYNNYYIGIL